MINKKLAKSILIYIIFILVFFFIYKLGRVKEYSLLLILGLVFIFIKDILIFFVDLNKKYIDVFNFKKLFKDFYKNRVSIIDFLLILNRNIIFPIILIGYMIYLLIGQTHLFGFNKNSLFIWFNQNYILGITIFSGILTIFKEDKDKKYFISKLEGGFFSKNILLTIFLSLLGTYIIFEQVVKLGFLFYPISIISGILIFLVGISILEDDESNLENNFKKGN